MRAEYVEAIETRLRWLRQIRRPEHRRDWMRTFLDARLLDVYTAGLEDGPLYVMVPRFCALVAHATMGMPDDVTFDATWCQTPTGWLYLSTPFELPQVAEPEDGSIESTAKITLGDYRLLLRAVHWRVHPTDGRIQVICYGSVATLKPMPKITMDEYFPISYFSLRAGQVVGDRVREFEAHSGNIVGGAREIESGLLDLQVRRDGGHYIGPDAEHRHEMRWLYAALHLMSQRLAVMHREPTDRHTRRRNERAGTPAPPFVHVITLRRLASEPDPNAEPRDVEWHWSWVVEGHWRWQNTYKDGVPRRIFIQTYIKGPMDESRPLKEPGVKLFSAER